ncbi:hypothetical protein [Bradyrhizobium sp. McL0616]|uniref:hypothetical protein n=1 Tax=Bradyrhizobium sp. McL0616 TaxID=3415674 RepID=UPI003CF65A49
MFIHETDRDILRLINAFKEIKSRGTRRAVVMLLEDLVQKDAAPKNALQKSG